MSEDDKKAPHWEPREITPEMEALVGPEFMARLRGAVDRMKLQPMAYVEEIPCKHCGRCVLCGPPCCQGMIDDIEAEKAAQKAVEDAARAERREAKRQRRLARRAERRKAALPSLCVNCGVVLAQRGRCKPCEEALGKFFEPAKDPH